MKTDDLDRKWAQAAVAEGCFFVSAFIVVILFLVALGVHRWVL